MKSVVNIGILAHVDAGKTTVSEQLLYMSGVLKSLGRVDHGNTLTDGLQVERERGITVRSATVSFDYKDLKINLIDTPGHIDFIAEVERSLSVIDIAILLISAKEGIQAQSRVHFETLKRLGIPTFIFINKLDRVNDSIEPLYRDIRNQLSDDLLMMQRVIKIAEKQWNIIPWQMVENGAGIPELLEGIAFFAKQMKINRAPELSALVYKVEWLNSRVKRTYFKVFGGKVSSRDSIEVYGKAKQFKVKNLKGLENCKVVAKQTILAGDIGIVENCDELEILDILGTDSTHIKRVQNETPMLRVSVHPVDHAKRSELISALFELAEEEPLMQCEVYPESNEIVINLHGLIQKEIVEYLLLERYGLAVIFSDVSIIYLERPLTSSSITINMGEKLNPYRATIRLVIDPLPIGSGVEYETKVSYGYLNKTFQRAVYDGVMQSLKGIYGWRLTDVNICFDGAYYDSVTSTPSDFRHLAQMVLMEAIATSKTMLLQPRHKFIIKIPNEFYGKIVSNIALKGGRIEDTHYLQNEVELYGFMPVEMSILYHIEIKHLTEGRGFYMSSYSGYEPFEGSVVVKSKEISGEWNRAQFILSKNGSNIASKLWNY